MNEKDLPRKGRFDQLFVDDVMVFMIDGRPFLVSRKGRLIPALQNDSILAKLPRVIVDMGAIPHVVNGADIMAPGIRKIEGEFAASGLVVVADEKFGKPLAIGAALVSSQKMSETRKGKVIENLHYVGDSAWNATKAS